MRVLVVVVYWRRCGHQGLGAFIVRADSNVIGRACTSTSAYVRFVHNMPRYSANSMPNDMNARSKSFSPCSEVTRVLSQVYFPYTWLCSVALGCSGIKLVAHRKKFSLASLERDTAQLMCSGTWCWRPSGLICENQWWTKSAASTSIVQVPGICRVYAIASEKFPSRTSRRALTCVG